MMHATHSMVSRKVVHAVHSLCCVMVYLTVQHHVSLCTFRECHIISYRYVDNTEVSQHWAVNYVGNETGLVYLWKFDQIIEEPGNFLDHSARTC
jgi:hypothetical protein